MKDLIKNIPTNELVEELINRDGVKLIDTGTFKNYSLKAKYNAVPVETDKVIALPLGMILNV